MPLDCPVCGENFASRAYGGENWAYTNYLQHLRDRHSEYQKWHRRWRLELYGMPPLFIFGLALLSIFPIGLTLLGFGAVLLPILLRQRSTNLNRFRLEWKSQPASVQAVTETQAMPLGAPTSIDAEILESTKALAQQLNLFMIHPSQIEWVDYIPMPRGGQLRVDADIPMVENHRLVLPARLRNSLTAEDWRVLIASNLVTRSWARSKRKTLFLTTAVIASGAYAVFAFFTIPAELAEGHGAIVAQPLVAILIALGSLFTAVLLNVPKIRQEVFTADQQAATFVGRDHFQDALLKLEQLGEDHSRGKKTHTVPSLRERLDNLKMVSS